MLDVEIDHRDVKRLEHLARSVPSGLLGAHGRLLDAGLLRPGFLYRDADPTTRDRLLAVLRELDRNAPGRQGTEAKLVNDVLVALAWIGDAVVQRAFAAWRSSSPSWVSAIHVAPHSYAEEAGWNLRADGTRQDLYLPLGRAIVRGEPARGPLHVLVPHDDRCRHCSQQLGVLFDLDIAISGLPLVGRRLIVPFCHHCSTARSIYFRVDDIGARWHEKNDARTTTRCDFNPWNEGPLVLGPPLSTPFERHGWQDDDLGHLGGVPGWIDDAYHPACLDCGEPSLFVGQLEVSSGGRFYAFSCQPCGVVTTTYQQT